MEERTIEIKNHGIFLSTLYANETVKYKSKYVH